MRDLTFFVGVALVTTGVALVYVPAALVLAGLVLAAVAVLARGGDA